MSGSLTSLTPLSPFSGKELKDMLDLVCNYSKNRDNDSHKWVTGELINIFVCPLTEFPTARIMGYFGRVPHLQWESPLLTRVLARAKFMNFCGQPFARLDADQSVYNSGNRSSWIATFSSWCINIFLFGGPHAYMSELRKIWVDHTINSVDWKDFNERLSSQWTSLALYVRVISLPYVSLDQRHDRPQSYSFQTWHFGLCQSSTINPKQRLLSPSCQYIVSLALNWCL